MRIFYIFLTSPYCTVIENIKYYEKQIPYGPNVSDNYVRLHNLVGVRNLTYSFKSFSPYGTHVFHTFSGPIRSQST